MAGVIHRESKGLQGTFASLQTSQTVEVIKIKVSFKNSASEILFRTYLLRNLLFSPNADFTESTEIAIQVCSMTQREFLPSR